jgi:periplasmic protein TonB
MIGRARALAFLGSAALHVGAVVAVLTLATSLRQAEPLFIDLTGGSEAADNGGARAAEPGVGAAKAPPARDARGPHARRPQPPEPAAPSWPPESAPVPAPVPAPAFSATREAAPAERPVPPPAAETSAADTSTAVGGAAATGGRSERAATSDAPGSAGESQAAVGGGGSRLALAGPGTGRSDIPPEFGPYLAGFRQRLQKSLIYPLVARRRGLEGRVEIELVLEPSGRVRDVAVVLSSSYALLDDAAVEAVKSIPPEPLPVQAKRQTLRVRLPVVFQLQ